MKRSRNLAILLAGMVTLGGCSVSGVLDQAPSSVADSAVSQTALPPIASSSSDKFSQNDQQSITVAENGASQQVIGGATSQAYADATLSGQSIETQKAALKPFVGQWSLNDPNARVRSGGLAQAEPQSCMINLESVQSNHGYRATGSSACPTNLFMLDSWVPFDGALVLRDHMGDKIIQLSSRGPDLWVGVHEDGTTFLLRRS